FLEGIDDVRLLNDLQRGGLTGRIALGNFRETKVKQLAGIRKALRIAGGLHDNRDYTAAIALGSRGDTVASFRDRTSLKSVQTLVRRHGVEHVVGVVVPAAIKGNAALGGDAQDIWVVLNEAAGEHGLRASGDV